MAAAAVMRQVADSLSSGVGQLIGTRVAGPAGGALGAAIAPDIIERGSLAVAKQVKRRSRKTARRAKAMSRAMMKVNKKARLKSGKMKKGWSQGKIMRESHKECKRMMK